MYSFMYYIDTIMLKNLQSMFFTDVFHEILRYYFFQLFICNVMCYVYVMCYV